MFVSSQYCCWKGVSWERLLLPAVASIHQSAQTSYLMYTPRGSGNARGLPGPSLASLYCEPAKAGLAKPKKGISALVQGEMATNGSLHGMVPTTKRKGSELFLGRVQDSCQSECGFSHLESSSPDPGPAGSRRSTLSARSAELTAPAAHASSHGPLQKLPPLACPAWAGRARTQATLLGPADSDESGPILSLLLCWGGWRQRTAQRILRREHCPARCLSHAP